MKAGLNLFSIRNLIASEEQFLDTAKKLKDMGYEYLQFSGAPFNPQIIKNVIKKSGLNVYLTHVPFDRIIGDTEKLIEEHLSFDCKNIGLGAMPLSAIADEDECKKTIELLDLAAAKMLKAGAKFFYHHHHFEFFKFSSGKNCFDYMIENAKNINFTIDTYWLQYGGVSILEFLDRVKGRMECVHLKDYRIIKKDEGGFVPEFAPVGEGTINFHAVVEKMKTLGVKYYFVEQDNAAGYENPLAEVEKSIRYINNNL